MRSGYFRINADDGSVNIMQEIKETVTLTNELGLHARAAALFVKTASRFNSTIIVKKDGHDANGKSITSLIMLTAPRGAMLEISATGDDAADCVGELKKLVAARFGEER